VLDPNYYEMLEIAPSATPEEVREAYRLLAMVWHPDRFPKDSKLWAHANEKMQQINEAYNALKNAPPVPAQPAASAASPHPANDTGRYAANSESEQRRHVHDQERQRIDVRQNAEAKQRRIGEQKKREEEQRQAAAAARQNVESEQRKAEADRLRVLMREAQRIDEIKHRRSEQGQCILCGRPLGRMDKIARRDRHRECSEFTD